ncbi:hypothetical protein C900_05173 [Fulvivirga imtechensis AK7]|uniref:eCIS core domain-containing protein n=1 Tax=Fulvivirga imtechensis AK7 TaxID=1237149 RepID=L8JP70_9BACT|nr:DUF4157 domain-containing protein [Fulvivirga imtechensis]ELR69289.1 hypothetical protein C900_05173 [Fulvivirga imtechensis AK7]
MKKSMPTHAEKKHENKKQPAANEVSRKRDDHSPAFQFVDNRPEAIAQRALQEVVNNSPQVKEAAQLQAKSANAIQNSSSQKKNNNTGLPDHLKTGIEALSGHSMDDVKVHYNSDKPAQLQAHAFAQGTHIHLAPGQEKHLPHEAWHVVQQKQGRVKAVFQMKGNIHINTEADLEHEADIMGEKALKDDHGSIDTTQLKQQYSAPSKNVFQMRHIGLFGLEAEVVGERLSITSLDLEEDSSYPIISDPNVVLEEYSLGRLSRTIKITTDNEVKKVDKGVAAVRSFTVEFIQHPVDILGDPKSLEEAAQDWQKAAAFWAQLFDQKDSISFTEMMESDPNVTLENDWESPQFDPHEGNANITTKTTTDSKTNSLDWTKLAPDIDVKSEDPQVSPQLTAGASLIALEKSYLATLHPLAQSKPFDKQAADKLTFKYPENDEERGEMESLELIKLITRYIRDSRRPVSKQKRYGKEYIKLMSRTSLDSIFNGMSSPGKKAFLRQTVNYLNGHENDMSRLFKVVPSELVIGQDASKEEQASTITVEHLLLTLIKLKKDEAAKIGFSRDNEAPQGDAFSQAGLAGLSEINPESDYNITRFGLNESDEMMKGVKGVIFENRFAKVIPLSEMATLFVESARALKLVEERMQHEKDKAVGLVPVSEVRDLTPGTPQTTGVIEERNVSGIEWSDSKYSGY